MGKKDEERKASLEQFLSMVKGRPAINNREQIPPHKLFILKDEGLYRHLRFRTEIRSPICGWDLITWPGTIVFDGDFGTYMFQRIEDMAYFFGASEPGKEDELFINPGYWAEKLVAISRHRPHMVYDREGVEADIKERYDNYCAENPELSDEKKDAIWDKIDDTILQYSEYSSSEACEFEMHQRLDEYCNSKDDEDAPIIFHDTWEWSLKTYSNDYIWALYCIVWGLKTYFKEVKK